MAGDCKPGREGSPETEFSAPLILDVKHLEL